MSIRPFRDIKRRKTKTINVGTVKVGGENPISVQSMTNTLTSDVKSTIKQIQEIQSEGAGFAGFATWLDMSPADSDMFGIPDGDSVIQLPWNKEIAWVASDLYMDDKPVEASPRIALKRQIENPLIWQLFY